MKRRGMTLLELLIAMVVGSLLMSVILGLFNLGQKTFLSALDETGMTRSSYLVPRDLVDRMMASTPDSVSATNGSLAFLTAYDDHGVFQTTPQGTPRWRAYETYFIRTGTDELRSTDQPFTAAQPVPLPAPQLEALKSSSGRLVASGVTAMQLLPIQKGSWQLKLSLEYHGIRRTYRGEVSQWAAPLN